jgi:hypothetical protein
LRRRFEARRPNQRRLGDVTYMLKTELVMHCDYRTRDPARSSVFDYVECSTTASDGNRRSTTRPR